MAYGLEIFNGNGDLQLSTTSTNKGFIVTDSGTATSTPNKLDFEKELLFCRPASRTNNKYMFGVMGTKDSFGKRHMAFKDSFGSNLSCDFIVAKVSTEFTQSSSGYGIQVFNSEGDLSFDSGLYQGDGGIGITDYLQARTGSGDFDLLDTDRDKYALMNNSFFNEGAFEVGYYYGTNLQQTGIFYYGAIYFEGNRFEDDEAGPNTGSTSVFSIPNFGAIFLAEGGSV